MEKREWEKSNIPTSRKGPQEFLRRIKLAESRGFKISGSISESDLLAFETRGINPKGSLKCMELTASERERIRLMKLKDAEEEQTQGRIDLKRKELTQAQKFEHLHIIQANKPVSKLFL